MDDKRTNQLNSVSHYLGNGAQIMQLLAAEEGKRGTDLLYALRLVKEALKIVRGELNGEERKSEFQLHDVSREPSSPTRATSEGIPKATVPPARD